VQKKLLASLTDYETWADRACSITRSKFPCGSAIIFHFLTMTERTNLRRAIDKITSKYRNIEILIASAWSPRLHAVYQRKFSITVVPVPVPSMPAWPTREQQWCEIRDAMYRIADYQSTTSTTTENFPLAAPWPVVHCEISLILHLDLNTANSTYNYIGVSKFSCKACYLWIEAHNKCAKRTKRYTGGSHDKWYEWCMPTCSKEIKRNFVELVATEYSCEKARQGEACLIPRSDSSVVSFNSVPINPEEDDEMLTHWRPANTTTPGAPRKPF